MQEFPDNPGIQAPDIFADNTDSNTDLPTFLLLLFICLWYQRMKRTDVLHSANAQFFTYD